MAITGPIPNIVNQDEKTIQLQGMDSPITNEAYQNAYGQAPPPYQAPTGPSAPGGNGYNAVQNGQIVPQGGKQSNWESSSNLDENGKSAMQKSAEVDAAYDKANPSSALTQGQASQGQPTAAPVQPAPSSALTQGNRRK